MLRRHSSWLAIFRTMLLSVVATAALWASPASAQQTITLVGQVRSISGGLVPAEVTLRLETEDGSLVEEKLCGSDGRFVFNNLSNVKYRMRVTAPGFQTLEEEVDLFGPRNNVSVQFALAPLTKVKAAPSDLPALTDEAAPRHARKEYEEGKHAIRKKNAHEALDHFEKAVKEYPCFARAQSDLALVLIEQNNPSLAEAALRKSIKCDAGYVPAYIRLGMLFIRGKNFAESENTLKEGLRLSPDTWELHYELAAAQSGLEQYRRAVDEYLKVRSLNPSPPPEMHVELADLFHRLGEYDKAYAEMQAYLAEAPDGRFAEKTKQVMHNLESSGLVHIAQYPPAQSVPPER